MKTQRIQSGSFLIVAAVAVVIAMCSRWLVAPVTADEQPAASTMDDPTEQQKATALLSELLIRNRDAEISLASLLNSGQPLTEQNFDAIVRVFDTEWDSLQLNAQTGRSINVRTEALQRLKSVSSDVLRSWSTAREPFASADLRHAATLEDLMRVEHRYPLTHSGVKAGLSAAALLHLRGNHHLAHLRLRTLEETVAGTHLESSLRNSAEALHRSLDKAKRSGTSEPDPQHVSDHVRQSLASRSFSPTIAPVWPKKTWSWTELIEGFPQAPQPVTWRTLSPFLQDSFYSLDEFSNWRPILAGGLLIHRTPMRIVAIDVQSGQEHWSVPTDTVAYSNAELSSRRESPQRPTAAGPTDVSASIESIRDMQAYGMMSADSQHLYFLDGLTLVDGGEDANLEDHAALFGRFLPPRREYPSRLVALRLREGGVPEVAWIAGSPGQDASGKGFGYRPIRAISELNEIELTSSRRNGSRVDQDFPETLDLAGSRAIEPSLDGHLFLSPPCGAGDQLFMITEFARQTYVTSLLRQTGRILWQRPVANFGLRNLPTESSLCVRGNCLICDGVLCCVFHDGVVVGLQPADGQILWANAYRESHKEPDNQRFPFQFIASENVLESAAIIPVATSSLLVALHPASDRIFAMEARTGSMRWIVSRAAFGVPSVDGERDTYIAGVTDSQVILLGEHHCRALDIRNGEQQWTINTGEASGRAEVSNDRCLIPQKNGQLLTVDLATGRLHQVRHRFLPEAPDQPWGALLCSDTQVFLSTPVSVTSFFRCDAVLQNEQLFKSIDQSEQLLTKARMLLLNHSDDEAIRLLTEAAGIPSDSAAVHAENNAEIQTEIHRTLAEVILQRWADHYVAALLESRQQDATATTSLSGTSDIQSEARTRLQQYGTSAEVLRLGELTLDSDQQLRAAILALLSQPGFKPDADDLAELESFSEWSRIQPLTDDWSVRPDLLLSPLIRDAHQSVDQNPITISNCRSIALKMLQFPDLMSDNARTEALAQQLISIDDFALAEALLLVWKRTSASEKAESLLQVVRRTNIAGKDRFERGFVAKNVGGKKLSVDVIDEMDVSLAATSWNVVSQSSLKASRQLPSWLPYQVSIARTADGGKYLNIAERRSGSIVATITPRSQVDDLLQVYSTESPDDDQPALLPVLCSDSFEMLNLTRPERSKVLWVTRPIEVNNHRSLQVDLEFGPVLPECIIWYAGGTLRCTQSITGEDLWTRRMHLKGSEDFVRGLKRIFGDHRAVVVLSEDNSKFERFRTRDGQSLGTGMLRIRANSDVLPVGRFLVYPDPNGTICIFNGETGTHQAVEGSAGTLGVTTLLHTFHRISGNRIVTINSRNELVVFDVTTAKVECRIPLQPHLRNDQIFSLIAFEQHGRLFVGVEDELNMYRDELMEPGDDLPAIRFGQLFHIDPVRGVIQWNLRTENQTFVVPAGDPTDVLVAIRDTSWTSNEDEMKRSSIRITLIDGTSGKEIMEETVSSRRPYRISHFAAEGLLEFVAAETVTRIRVDPDQSDSGPPEPSTDEPSAKPRDKTEPASAKIEAP